MGNQHHVKPVECRNSSFDHLLVAVKIRYIEQKCFDTLRAAHLQIIAGVFKFLGGAGNQEKLGPILRKALGCFMGDGRGCPYNQYSHILYTITNF